MVRLLGPSFAFLVLLCALAGRAHADEESGRPANDLASARAAWRWLEATDAYRSAVLKQARILREGAPDDAHRRVAQRASLDVLRRTSELRDRAEDAFRLAFEASDLEAWDPAGEDDAEILRTGLDLAARRALDEEPARAVLLWDRLIATFPDSLDARRARTTWLPIALPSTGDLDPARKRLRALHAEVESEWKPDLMVAVGDTYALEGDYETARTCYASARQGIPEEADRNDPRGRLRGHLELRLKLVGKRAPELEEATWFGGEPRSLASLRETVVLLDVSSTWCGPCLRGLPHLDALQRAHGDAGLQVLFVTRVYDRKGVVPERADPETGAVLPRELYDGEGREAYEVHLRAFRARVDVSFPFLLVDPERLREAYPVVGLPTVLVLDPDGTVGFVAVGGRRHRLIELAVTTRLRR